MKRDITIIFVFAAVILLFNLGAGSLSSWDEALYAQVSREVLENGSWMDLTWGGLAWSDKPPLYMWATAFFYNVFGVNEFSVRLFSALSGIFLALVTYLLGARIFTRRVGMMSAIMLASIYHFIWMAKSGTMDVSFTLFLALSIYFFLISEEKRFFIMCSFLFFGLAFMTKGVGALIAPAIIGCYVLVTGSWRKVLDRYFAAGVLIFLLIAGSWYVTEIFNYGGSFLRGQFFQHLVQRTTSTMDGHQGSWLTYINVVLYKGKPWGACGLIALPFLVFWSVRKRLRKAYILISWSVLVLVVFSVFKTKLHWYIIPAYPAVCIISAWGVNAVLRRYALAVTVIVSLTGVLYFGTTKEIFTLDYNPEIKYLSVIVYSPSFGAGSVYLYEVGDPAVRFYFGKNGKYLSTNADLKEAIKETGAVIITERYDPSLFDAKRTVITKEGTGVTVVHVK